MENTSTFWQIKLLALLIDSPPQDLTSFLDAELAGSSESTRRELGQWLAKLKSNLIAAEAWAERNAPTASTTDDKFTPSTEQIARLFAPGFGPDLLNQFYLSVTVGWRPLPLRPGHNNVPQPRPAHIHAITTWLEQREAIPPRNTKMYNRKMVAYLLGNCQYKRPVAENTNRGSNQTYHDTMDGVKEAWPPIEKAWHERAPQLKKPH